MEERHLCKACSVWGERSLALPQHLNSLVSSWEENAEKVCKICISSCVETEVDMLSEIRSVCGINKAIALPFLKGQVQHFLRCWANLQSKKGWRGCSEGMWDAQYETVWLCDQVKTGQRGINTVIWWWELLALQVSSSRRWITSIVQIRRMEFFSELKLDNPSISVVEVTWQRISCWLHHPHPQFPGCSKFLKYKQDVSLCYLSGIFVFFWSAAMTRLKPG